jgi:hypothetical protein
MASPWQEKRKLLEYLRWSPSANRRRLVRELFGLNSLLVLIICLQAVANILWRRISPLGGRCTIDCTWRSHGCGFDITLPEINNDRLAL